MATTVAIQSAACTSGIGWVSSPVQLLVLAAQLYNTRANPEPPPPSTLLNGLTAYWNLDEASGDAFESVSAAFSMIDVAGVGTAAGPAGVGTARSFNGTTQYMVAPDSAAYVPFPMTMNLWVYSDATGRMFVAKDDFESGQRDYAIYSTGTTIQQYFFSDLGNYVNEQSFSAEISSWLMITATWEAGLLSIYSDTTLIGSVPAFGLFFPGTNSLSLGARYRDSSGNFDSPLSGRLAKCGIWNRVLTSDEILELYNAGIGLAYNEL